MTHMPSIRDSLIIVKKKVSRYLFYRYKIIGYQSAAACTISRHLYFHTHFPASAGLHTLSSITFSSQTIQYYRYILSARVQAPVKPMYITPADPARHPAMVVGVHRERIPLTYGSLPASDLPFTHTGCPAGHAEWYVTTHL